MKKFLYPLILFIPFLFQAHSVKATHLMGVDITYSCTGPCTYRIVHKTYYDCTGAAMGGYIPVINNAGNAPPPSFVGLNGLTITGGAGCSAPTPTTGWTFESYLEVTPLCPDALNPPAGTPASTGCNGTNPNPPINGVAEVIYYRDYNFCNVNCNSYTISWSDCCRNSVITSGAADEGIYSGGTVIDLSTPTCNSSPTFVNKPVPYICAGQQFTFNQGAFDPDGDSISYALGPCLRGAGNPVTYNPGYSNTQPLGTTWDVQINPITGDITMTPSPTGNEVVVVMCIIVTEWRNGNPIGQVTRDMQITVIPNCTSTNPFTGGIQNAVLGTDAVPIDPLSFNEVRVCAGVELCMEIPVVPQDTALDYTITWSQNIPGATFVDASNPTITNIITGKSPVARFCWTPPPNTPPGSYFFVVTVNDDACPVPGFNQFTIIIYIDDVFINADAVGVPIGCNEVQLSALPNSILPSPYNNVFVSFQWSGNGNLNLNPNTSDSSFSHLYPAPNTYFFNMALEDTFGCRTTIPGIVDLTTGAIADAGPDVSVCSNYTFQLGTPAIPGQTYRWSPDSAISDTSLAQPTFTFPNTGQQTASIFYTLEVSDGICTTFDYTRVEVNPSLETDILPIAPKVCNGSPVTLTAQGNLGSGNTYVWSTGDTTQSITVSPSVTTTYSVVTFNNGCSSIPKFVTVEVQEGPPALIAGDLTVCPGGNTTLSATGADSYIWSAGGFSGPTIALSGINNDSVVYVVGFDAQGCPGDTTFTTIQTLPQPLADFGVPSVCNDQSSIFTDNSSVPSGSIVSWRWDFDDASGFVSGQNPAYQYTMPGTYNVQLLVTTARGCQDSVSIPVTVHPVPDADFTFTNVCDGLPNQFTDASTILPGGLITSYVWDYGDGSPTGTGASSAHTYPQFGYYNVSLTVTSDNGCTDQFTRTIFVNPNPVADFEVVNACKDSIVLASTAATVAGSLDFIQSHSWNFGDPGSGGSNTSTLENPSHVYGQDGSFLVTLTVTTANGCSDVIQRDVTVYPDPVADFVVDQQCENVPTIFTSTSTSDPATPIEQLSWGLGNDLTSTQPNPQVAYQTNGGPGTYTFMLAVRTSAGCVDTVRRDMAIHPAPIADFQVDPVCMNDTSVFINTSQIAYGDIVGYSWNFGDAAGNSDLTAPSYSYQFPGEYEAILTAVSDSGCSRTWTRTAIVHELPNIFRLQEDTVCFGDPATVAAIAPPPTIVNWYYNETDEAPFHTGYAYTTPPLPYATTYYVEPRSEEGCINVRQPVSGYVYNDEDLIASSNLDVVELPLAVVDFTTGSSISIDQWVWNFGDGNTSTQPEPTHEYKYPGIYEVEVMTTDINGCERSANTIVEVKKIVTISLPNAFSPNGDGFNDTYRIGFYNITNFNIQIFNRWGEMVFESNNPDFEWNGESIDGQPVQEGVYVFNMQAVDFDGNEINESRTITVLR